MIRKNELKRLVRFIAAIAIMIFSTIPAFAQGESVLVNRTFKYDGIKYTIQQFYDTDYTGAENIVTFIRNEEVGRLFGVYSSADSELTVSGNTLMLNEPGGGGAMLDLSSLSLAYKYETLYNAYGIGLGNRDTESTLESFRRAKVQQQRLTEMFDQNRIDGVQLTEEKEDAKISQILSEVNEEYKEHKDADTLSDIFSQQKQLEEKLGLSGILNSALLEQKIDGILADKGISTQQKNGVNSAAQNFGTFGQSLIQPISLLRAAPVPINESFHLRKASDFSADFMNELIEDPIPIPNSNNFPGIYVRGTYSKSSNKVFCKDTSSASFMGNFYAGIDSSSTKWGAVVAANRAAVSSITGSVSVSNNHASFKCIGQFTP
ncbi:MAG: hypothetical protein LBR54_00925 [Oscillospiraceae bacterium]|jgi:hypothetical protein|nr:hypothetical protein [Oscillospiraceae bacterium]